MSTKIQKPIGIYDPEGLNINPLTNQPYQNLYKHIQKTIDGVSLPATYANLAKIWKTKLVYVHKDQILYSIQNNQITLAKAGTGVGKTVLIPKIALHAFNYQKKVICTIPKKVITRTTAEFAAQCLDVKIGEEVGYYFRGSNKTSDKSKLIFTTTGSLISKITGSDPYLSDYDCVVIDEAHERTVQTDLLLLLLKKAMMKRKSLKVVIMSATINLKVFRDYFPSKSFKFGEVDAGEFTSYPIQDFWLQTRPKPNEWKELAIQKIVKILKETKSGDILVFIRASGDGKTLCQLLMQQVRRIRDENINPFCVVLAGNSTKEDEHLATDQNQYTTLLDEYGKSYTRKIVMSTNVAESSLTVDGVVFVIDSGLEYEESYDPHTMSRCLSEEFVANSGMKQRRGRGGRTQPGVCYHLYTKAQAQQFQDYPTPEIQKTDLTSDLLDLMKLEYINNIKDLKHFLNEFISPPKKIFIESALKTLVALGAFTSKEDDGKITELGFAISKFRAIKPHLAKALIASYFNKCSRSVSDIIGLLIISDGMIKTLFMDFKENKKKSPEYNKKQKNNFLNSRKLFNDQSGDIMTLLNMFNIFKSKLDETKKIEVQNYLEQVPKGTKSIVQLINENPKQEITKSINQRTPKSIKLLKSLKVPKSIINNSSKNKSNTMKSVSKKTKKTTNQNNSQSEDKVSNSIKKWSMNHFINYKKLIRVRQVSKQIQRTLKEVCRMPSLIPKKKSNYSRKQSRKLSDNDETTMDTDFFEPSKQEGGRRISPLAKYFENEEILVMNEDDRIILSLLEGIFINIALKNDNKYKPCFPITKMNARINMDSFLKNPSKLVFYDELFMFNNNPSMLKLNIVNKIPEHLVSYVKENYKSKIRDCFIVKKKSKKRKSLKKGRRLKTFRRRTNKFNRRRR